MGINDINAGESSISIQALSLIIRELEEAKAYDICQLDVRNLTDITDFMIIASGSSHRHVHAMADRIRESTRKESFRPIGIEGDSENDWVLMDFSDVVVHLMMPAARELYNLESLWNDHLGGISKTRHDSLPER